MSKKRLETVYCACCGNEIEVERWMSGYGRMERVDLDGNRYGYAQYEMEECNKCGCCLFEIDDDDIKVNKRILKKFVLPEKLKDIKISSTHGIERPRLEPILKAAFIYKKNKRLLEESYALRLVSFYLYECGEMVLSKEFLKQSTDILYQYYENGMSFVDEEQSVHENLSLSAILIDCYRQLGMFDEAKEILDSFGLNLKREEIEKIVYEDAMFEDGMTEEQKHEAVREYVNEWLRDIAYWRPIFNLEQKLIDQKDAGKHCRDEVDKMRNELINKRNPADIINREDMFPNEEDGGWHVFSDIGKDRALGFVGNEVISLGYVRDALAEEKI